MPEMYVLWATDADKAQARLEQITQDEKYRVLRRDVFALIQAEDIDNEKSLASDDTRYCIVFQMG